MAEETIPPVPLMLQSKEISLDEGNFGTKENPSQPQNVLYRYALANQEHLDQALKAALNAQIEWKRETAASRSKLLFKVAEHFREKRGDLIGAMLADTAKTVAEADVEVSEAIDFIDYYRRNAEEWHSLRDIVFEPKGVVLVASPWNFPCSIPVGGITAALAAGNSVIFKPAPEAIFVGWLLASIFWESGISRDLLQFITCDDDPIGSLLIQDTRLSTILLTGATATARHFLQLRPGLDLSAQTVGKKLPGHYSLSRSGSCNQRSHPICFWPRWPKMQRLQLSDPRKRSV